MAIGTLTVTSQDIEGPNATHFVDEITLVGDSSYPTGGMTGVQAALRAATKDQRQIVDVRPRGPNGGYDLVWDGDNGKLIAFTVGGSAGAVKAELANATNLSGTTFKLLVYSK